MDRASVEAHRVKSVLTQQEHCCGACGEEFDAREEVFLIQIVRPFKFFDEVGQQWALHFQQQLGKDGDFDSAPYFFHGSCWEENAEELRELVQDCRPVGCANPACECEFCGSHIAEGALMAVVHYGEFKLSERQPNGRDALDVTLEPMSPTYVCLSCLNEFNINVIEGLWPEDGTVATEEEENQPWASG